MDEAALEEYYVKSGNRELCQSLYTEAIDYFKKNDTKLEGFQAQSLLNHIAEMVKRDINQEQLEIDDKSVFAEVSDASIQKAKGIVDQLAHISNDEVYLLAIHFEIAHVE